MLRASWVVLLVVGLTFAAGAAVAVEPGDCLSDDEAELLELIDQYRADNGRPAIPWSKSLSTVAQWHVWDLEKNSPHISFSCNLHSWSDWGEIWTPVCFTSDFANASGMWVKPAEITGNVYNSSGYEIASSGASSPAAALSLWQNSPGHNDVILNQGIWVNQGPWPAMGAGMFEGFSVVWFGGVADPAGSIEACSSGIFSDGFDSGNTSVWSKTVP